jgi:hypothetical protein
MTTIQRGFELLSFHREHPRQRARLAHTGLNRASVDIHVVGRATTHHPPRGMLWARTRNGTKNRRGSVEEGAMPRGSAN